MSYRKKSLVFIAVVLLLFALSSCAVDKSPSDETGVSDGKALPGATVEDEKAPDEEVQDEEAPGEAAGSKEYEGWVGAYLDILSKNSFDIEQARRIGTSDPGLVAIMDVFGDGTPELLYLYEYDDPKFFFDDDFPVPCLYIKIFSYSEQGGIESVSDICINFAAGGPNNYCVYLTREGELMLYRSYYANGKNIWGVWQIEPGRILETADGSGYYSVDLAKLYYVRPDEDGENAVAVYKSNGEEISKEQYDKTAKEIKDDVDYMIFPGLGDGEMYDEEFWKGVTPFDVKSMTYDEAVAWLEAQGNGQEQK